MHSQHDLTPRVNVVRAARGITRSTLSRWTYTQTPEKLYSNHIEQDPINVPWKKKKLNINLKITSPNNQYNNGKHI